MRSAYPMSAGWRAWGWPRRWACSKAGQVRAESLIPIDFKCPSRPTSPCKVDINSEHMGNSSHGCRVGLGSRITEARGPWHATCHSSETLGFVDVLDCISSHSINHHTSRRRGTVSSGTRTHATRGARSDGRSALSLAPLCSDIRTRFMVGCVLVSKHMFQDGCMVNGEERNALTN